MQLFSDSWYWLLPLFLASALVVWSSWRVQGTKRPTFWGQSQRWASEHSAGYSSDLPSKSITVVCPIDHQTCRQFRENGEVHRRNDEPHLIRLDAIRHSYQEE